MRLIELEGTEHSCCECGRVANYEIEFVEEEIYLCDKHKRTLKSKLFYKDLLEEWKSETSKQI